MRGICRGGIRGFFQVAVALFCAGALLAPAFREAGYATAAVIGSLVLRSEVGLARGFDRYDDDIPRDATRKSTVRASGAT